jgi:hypothetical protein
MEEKLFNRVRDLLDFFMMAFKSEVEGDDAMIEALAQRISIGALLYSFLETDKLNGNPMGAFIDNKIGEWTTFLRENGFLNEKQVEAEIISPGDNIAKA